MTRNVDILKSIPQDIIDEAERIRAEYKPVYWDTSSKEDIDRAIQEGLDAEERGEVYTLEEVEQHFEELWRRMGI